METYEIVGIDVGNGMTKTAHSVFTTGIERYGKVKPAVLDKTVMYDGEYYAVGGKRIKSKTDSKSDNTHFILALAALGEELKFRNLSPHNVVISEGLPLERCVADKQAYDEEYYQKGKDIYFEYEDIPYNIHILDVLVNPQGVSAVIDKTHELPSTCLLVDVGTWTIDMLPVFDAKPSNGEALSIDLGVAECFKRCQRELRRRGLGQIFEEQIIKEMRALPSGLSDAYTTPLREVFREYSKLVAETLVEEGYNLKATPCIFLGGGSIVIANYGKEYFPLAEYMSDIHANAIGYEKIAKIKMRKRR